MIALLFDCVDVVSPHTFDYKAFKVDVRKSETLTPGFDSGGLYAGFRKG